MNSEEIVENFKKLLNSDIDLIKKKTKIPRDAIISDWICSIRNFDDSQDQLKCIYVPESEECIFCGSPEERK